MKQIRQKNLIAVFFATVLALAPVFDARAGSKHKNENSAFTNISIENFGKVNDHFYRGAQPSREGYGQLARLGVKTIIDLRDDAQTGAQSMAESAGLHYINLPMNDKRYPQQDAAQRFLEVANNSANWPIYVHCAGGRHRTGIMTAVYRITIDKWDIDQAYNEMKQYDFYTSWGHQPMKDYIFDFYRDFKKQDGVTAEHPAVPGTTNVNVK